MSMSQVGGASEEVGTSVKGLDSVSLLLFFCVLCVQASKQQGMSMPQVGKGLGKIAMWTQHLTIIRLGKLPNVSQYLIIIYRRINAGSGWPSSSTRRS